MKIKFESEKNPYTMQFSYIPPQYISRRVLSDEIINDLLKNTPGFRGHFITGVRGSGKTVLMAEIAKKMNEKEDWIVVDIENPEGDILESLARGLYRNPILRSSFIKAKLDMSILGIGISIENPEVIASNEADALDYMLQIVTKLRKRILVTIDEATYCKEIAEFSHTLSAYARKNYDVYVVMTGLKENIKAIKNDKSLTFLYRAKEHSLEPLNITAITLDYERTFQVTRNFAEDMAWLTKGYSFAFQVLGYLLWEKLSEEKSDEQSLEIIMGEYDEYLSEFVYDKIWSEIPSKERKVLYAIAKAETDDVKDIREQIKMSSSEFSVYRGRLLDRGLINGANYGKVKFILPRFEEYVILHYR